MGQVVSIYDFEPKYRPPPTEPADVIPFPLYHCRGHLLADYVPPTWRNSIPFVDFAPFVDRPCDTEAT